MSILANSFVYRSHFGSSFESLRILFQPPRITPRAIVRCWRPVLTAALSGVDSLKEALTDFGREQVLDFRIEKPEDVSWGACQKRQSRHIAKILAQVELCRTGDDIVNLAVTVLKSPNLEAFLYLHISDRDETAEPLSVPFDRVVSSVHPSGDHRPLPAETDAALLAFETELHNQHLEDWFREDFDIALPRPKAAASPARKRTFDRRLKAPTSEVIDLD